MGIVPFPTLRIRDTLRVIAVVDVYCLTCGHDKPLDVVALICRHGPNCSLMRAIKGFASCPMHGEEGIRYRVIGGPPAPYYALHLGALVEPACTVAIHCRACHRQSSVDVIELSRTRSIGPDARLADLADRCRCSGCGQSGWAEIRLTDKPSAAHSRRR